MRPFALSMLLLVLLVGCGKQKGADDQAGTASQSAYSDVIDGKQGYFVEQAAFASASDPVMYSIGDKFKLTRGQSSVLIINLPASDQAAGCILALQFPSFAAGTTQDFNGDTVNAQFWLMGKGQEGAVMASTGLISGSVHFIKKAKSTLNLGLNREVLDGIGDIEIAVSNIVPGALKFAAEKKFAARFQLPIITLAEMSKITQPV
jgi:hypothetical protein